MLLWKILHTFNYGRLLSKDSAVNYHLLKVTDCAGNHTKDGDLAEM